jgi:MFS family permease
MVSSLSPYQLRKARKNYTAFGILSGLSYNILAGNLLFIFVLRLGASSTYIGIINALSYMAFFFLPVGRILAKRFSIVGTFSSAWIIRYISLTSLVVSPFIYYLGYGNAALAIIILSLAVFHIARAIGTVGDNPVASLVSSGPDRGSYLTYIQITGNTVILAAGLIISLVLGRYPHLFIYALLFAIGVITGTASGLYLKKIPEPSFEETRREVRFIDVIRWAKNTPAFRVFSVVFFMASLITGVTGAFLVVYCRQVFGQSDGMVSFYAAIGGVGTVLVSMVIKFLVDRIGAKPLLLISIIISMAGIFPVLFFPTGGNPALVIAYMIFIFFTINFGFSGTNGVTQIYFISLVPEKLMLDMGILQWYCRGFTGTIGSLLAGFFFDALANAGVPSLLSFRIFFLILIGLCVPVLIVARKMAPLNAIPLKNALELIFSFNELKALFLLGKLDKSKDPRTEEALLDALRDAPSKFSSRDLFNRTRSPLLSIRLEALRTINSLAILDSDSEKALMNDIISNPYTTAYYSARILGDHGSLSSIPLLRESASSRDYMLAGESFIALAKLGDHEFRPCVENIILSSENPRLKIMGVEALGIYGSRNSISILLDMFRRTNPPPYLRDEIVLAIAAVLGTQKEFYPILDRFLKDESQCPTLAMDEVVSAIEYTGTIIRPEMKNKKPETILFRRQSGVFQQAVSDYLAGKDGSLLCRWILELPDNLTDTMTKVIFSESVIDSELSAYSRLRLLIVHWTTQELKQWAGALFQKF